jgi:hypothetical protein
MQEVAEDGIRLYCSFSRASFPSSGIHSEDAFTGVTAYDIIDASEQANETKRNRILFSGTHIENNGVAQLIEAWRLAPIAGWELHITGKGGLTDSLPEMAENVSGVNFHGLIGRDGGRVRKEPLDELTQKKQIVLSFSYRGAL